MDKEFDHTVYNGYNYLSMLSLMLDPISKMGPCTCMLWLPNTQHAQIKGAPTSESYYISINRLIIWYYIDFVWWFMWYMEVIFIRIEDDHGVKCLF